MSRHEWIKPSFDAKLRGFDQGVDFNEPGIVPIAYSGAWPRPLPVKRALITGITGMDGSHLADLLLEKGYEVHGLVRRVSVPTTKRIAHVVDRVKLHEADMIDQHSLTNVVEIVQPDEVYNMAAQSFVGRSWKYPAATAEITGLGALRMLEAVRRAAPEARFYQASSSEMFGHPKNDGLLDERTPIHPRSPYGSAKAFAHHSAVNYRESYGMHVSCGILFNHESERRGHEFVTRKITRQAAEVFLGRRTSFLLGNTESHRDWGYAPDYVEAAWRMLQQDEPDDYVVATGRARTVREFVLQAAAAAGLVRTVIDIDQDLFRPAELHYLCGDASKARVKLGWTPSTSFEDWVGRMVEADLAELGHERAGVRDVNFVAGGSFVTGASTS